MKNRIEEIEKIRNRSLTKTLSPTTFSNSNCRAISCNAARSSVCIKPVYTKYENSKRL